MEQPLEKPLISVTSVSSLPQECQDKIRTWYLSKKPYKWMCEELRGDGYLLNHTRLWHWCKNNLPGLSDSKDSPPDLTDEDRLTVERQVISSLLDMAGEAIRGIETPKICDVEDLNRLAAAVARLVAAQVQRDRLEFDKKGAIEKVRENFIKEVQRVLAGRPELVAAMHEVLSGTASDSIPNHIN